MDTNMTRAEHLEWAKERAYGQIDKHSGFSGWIAFKHDLGKHDELREHPAIFIGDEMMRMVAGPMLLTNPEGLRIFDVPGPFNMRKFIEGFN